MSTSDHKKHSDGDEHELDPKWRKSLALAHAASMGTISFNLLSKAKQKWCPKDAFTGESPAPIGLGTEGFRNLQVETILSYDQNQHRLLERMLEVIAFKEPRVLETGLDKIHFAFDPNYTPGRSLKQHKSKLNGEAFSSPAGEAFRNSFLHFMCDVIAPHVRLHMPNEDRIVYQVRLQACWSHS